VLFFGYDTLSALLADNGYFSLPVLLALLFIKPLCTAICLGSGLVGGTVAPSLFLGAVVGASFQKLSVLALASVASVPLPFALPDIVFAGTPAYALLGMASVLGGILRAPLTSSLLLFELTRDYKICVATMISAGIASAVANYDGGDFEEAAVGKPEATGAGPAMLHATEAGAKVTVAAAAATTASLAPPLNVAVGTIPTSSVPVEAATDDGDSIAAAASAPAPSLDVDKLLQLGLPFVTPSDAALDAITVDNAGIMQLVPLLSPEASLSDAVTQILAADAEGAIVWDEPDGSLCGLLTLERAVTALAAAGNGNGNFSSNCGSTCDGGCLVLAGGGSAARGVDALRRAAAAHAVVLDADAPSPRGLFSVSKVEAFAGREALRLLMRRR
jgi:Voltage gated chloride channel